MYMCQFEFLNKKSGVTRHCPLVEYEYYIQQTDAIFMLLMVNCCVPYQFFFFLVQYHTSHIVHIRYKNNHSRIKPVAERALFKQYCRIYERGHADRLIRPSLLQPFWILKWKSLCLICDCDFERETYPITSTFFNVHVPQKANIFCVFSTYLVKVKVQVIPQRRLILYQLMNILLLLLALDNDQNFHYNHPTASYHVNYFEHSS